MLSYAARRVVLLVPVLLGATVVVFGLIHLIPGDPAGALLGPTSSDATRAAFRHDLGLDQPLPIQYGVWLWHVLHLDLGISIARRQPVISIVWEAFQHTLLLAAVAALLANVVGLFLGIVAATRQFGIADRAAMGFAALATAIPSYWLGLILVVLLALKVQIFPTGGMTSAIDGGSPFDIFWHLVLPAMAAGAAPAGIVARTVRASVLEVLRLDFVQALRARGFSESTILFRHIVPNAFPTILTVMGLQAGYLLGGVAFVEVVFSWPGIGNLLFLSIGQRDYPVILGVMLFVSFVFVLLNLAVDLMHAALDPRVRTSVAASCRRSRDDQRCEPFSHTGAPARFGSRGTTSTARHAARAVGPLSTRPPGHRSPRHPRFDRRDLHCGALDFAPRPACDASGQPFGAAWFARPPAGN